MTMLDTVLDGPSLRQERRLITEVAGPRLRELAAPRADALPAGWSGGAPVYTVAAGGGIPVDVDGNSFIDLGSASRSPPSVTLHPQSWPARPTSSLATPTPASWPLSASHISKSPRSSTGSFRHPRQTHRAVQHRQ